MTAAAPSTDEWDESQLLENLRKLDELHRRLINLRTVIPTILHPLHAQYSTPTDLFHDFATRAAACSDDIAKFTTMYVQSRDIFAHADQSREQSKDGIQRLKGADMFLPDEDANADVNVNEPAPAQQQQQQQQSTARETADAPAGGNEAAGQELSLYEKQLRANFPETLDGDVDAVVDEARQRNQGVEILDAVPPKAGGRVWTIKLPKPVGVEVQIERGMNGKWDAVGVRGAGGSGEPTPTQAAILGAMEREVKALDGSGKFVLDMVAAYKSLYTEKCGKCEKLVKATGQGKMELPAVRKWETEGWKALHEDCV